MNKKNLRKGQTVWTYLVGYGAKDKSTEERIREYEVVSVSNKYIIAKPKGFCSLFDTTFDIHDLNQVYKNGDHSYVLYLTKEELFHDIWRSNTKEYIRESVRTWNPVFNNMSDEDLRVVAGIFKKYDKEDMKG